MHGSTGITSLQQRRRPDTDPETWLDGIIRVGIISQLEAIVLYEDADVLTAEAIPKKPGESSIRPLHHDHTLDLLDLLAERVGTRARVPLFGKPESDRGNFRYNLGNRPVTVHLTYDAPRKGTPEGEGPLKLIFEKERVAA